MAAFAVDKSGVMGQRVSAILALVVPRRSAGFRRWLARGLTCVVLLMVPDVVQCNAADYSNRELGFRMWLPNGFEDVSSADRPKGSLLMKAKFNRDKSLSRLLSVQDLGEVIRQDANFSKLKRGTGNVKQEKMRWGEFEVDVFNVMEGEAGMVYLSLNAQVPLRTRGIQVSLSALKTEERALRHEMEALLKDLEGPSNWVSSRQRAAAESSGTLNTVLAVSALVVLVGAALWGISKVQQ